MEVLVGAPTGKLQKLREDVLRLFVVIELDEHIAKEAIALRQKHRLKLPDAIIWSSARLNNALLVTRNSKDFPADDPGIRIPYQI
jgi:predicted nucleic acid-binding protein